MFEVVDRICSIPTELFDEGYRYFAFGVTSLFKNVPLNKTINIILLRIYKENLVKTNMRKSILEKLLKIHAQKLLFHLMVKFINRFMVCLWVRL